MLDLIRYYKFLVLGIVIMVGGLIATANYGWTSLNDKTPGFHGVGPESTIIYERRARDPKAYQHGDVVLFRSPKRAEEVSLGRVVGLPGDHVECRGGQAYINDDALETRQVETGAGSMRSVEYSDFPRLRVPGDSLFVLTDVDKDSSDSRSIGPIPIWAVFGRAVNAGS